MRHRVKRHQLALPADQRKALIRTLMISLFTYEKIETTEGRARAMRIEAEKLITKAKTDTVHTRRQVFATLTHRPSVAKVFELAERYKTRNGGYTRVIKSAPRQGDGAPQAFVELV